MKTKILLISLLLVSCATQPVVENLGPSSPEIDLAGPVYEMTYEDVRDFLRNDEPNIAHAFVAFDTVDRGKVWIEPQDDSEYYAVDHTDPNRISTELCDTSGWCWPYGDISVPVYTFEKAEKNKPFIN